MSESVAMNTDLLEGIQQFLYIGNVKSELNNSKAFVIIYLQWKRLYLVERQE